MSRFEREIGSTDYRNRVRGLLNVTKERGYGIDDRVRNLRLKIALRTVLLEARLTLPASQYRDHLSWLHGQVGIRETSFALGQGLLFTNIPAPPIDLVGELDWVSARLTTAASVIEAHLAAKRELCIAYLSGDAEKTLSICDQIENEIGDSHWLHSLRFAALQRFEGIDSQKAYLAKLRGRSRQGITAAFLYFTSIRNEPSVTLPWFENDIRRRSFSKKYPEHRSYLRFALLGEVPETTTGIADILRVEQAHSDPDLYESAIRVLQALATRSLSPIVAKAVERAVVSIGNVVSDSRLGKLKAVLNVEGRPTKFIPSEERVLAELVQTGHADSICPGPTELTDDPAAAIWHALANAALGASTNEQAETPANDLILKTEALCRRGDGFSASRMALAKEARNIHGLSAGEFYSAVCAAMSKPSLLDLWKTLPRASLASNAWGILDRLLIHARGSSDAPRAESDLERFFDTLASVHTDDVRACTPMANGIAKLHNAAQSGDYEGAYAFLDILKKSPSPLAKGWGDVIALEIFAANLDIQRSLELIGAWAATGKGTPEDLPIQQALEGLKTSHINQYGNEVTTPIAIDAWRKAADSDAKQTLLRMSFNRFMRMSTVSVPSAIPIEVMRNQHAEYVYFLEEVCTPTTMDMNPAFASSQQLSLERRSICALLRSLNPPKQSVYDDEIVSITQALSIWEGLKTIDGSRIHVDESAFASAIRSELEGSFARYASLVRAGVGVAEEFDVVLRKLLRQEGYAEGLAIPENEADELLTTMVVRMKEAFLTNSIYGLDGYVSKRIRHGSLIGHLRGPVERHKLITQRSEKSKGYESNQFWLQQLSHSDPSAKDRFAKALDEFSRSFDRELLYLKDERLQIKRDNGDGILDFPLTAAALHVIRSSIKNDVSIDGLIRAAVVAFWALLRPALSDAQDLVRTRFQSKVSEMFSKLQAAASASIRSEPFYGEFVNEVRLAAEETAIQVAVVSGWFERSGIDDHSRTYTLDDAVDIGVESARSAFAEFRPYVVKKCDPILMPGPSLQLIADVLLIALGNISSHSGLGNEPAVHIVGTIDEAREIASFKVSSKVAEGVRTSSVEQNLDTLRNRIASRDFDKFVSTEGNSGLLKLAAMVYQSELGDLQFGFTENGEFEVDIKLSFILDRKHAVEVVECAAS